MSATTVVRTGQPVRTIVRSRRLAPYRAAAIAGAAVATDRAFDPVHTHVPTCPLHAVTGLWCPFCGGLRAVYELTRLDFVAALHANLMFVVSVPALIALWVHWLARARVGEGRPALPRVAVIAIVVALAVFTLARNLPVGSVLRVGS